MHFHVEKTEIEVFHHYAESGVSEQPVGGETYQGAKRRVDSLMGENADFYASCEAGIEEFMGLWFNVQVVCIYDTKAQKYFFGKSAGWQIPSEAIDMVKRHNLDTYLRNQGISCIEELLGTDYSRAEAVKQAAELALATRLM